ncbi:uncharacterized protein LOC128383556 [Scomber scombrus]|uniref:Uncharacterized protein LOC128383556 n=1 Tax=Scomber scombrus TaxID=13677 RepID=A0AAV1Q7E5_SCOSC
MSNYGAVRRITDRSSGFKTGHVNFELWTFFTLFRILNKQQREKMICWILLLISLTSCVSGTQTSFQAEENHNITLEWMFTTKPNSSSTSLIIYRESLAEGQGNSVLYRVRKDGEVSGTQDEQFAGRVQFDKDALREGRIRLHVTKLRIEDSGLYRCLVFIGGRLSYDRCHLNVTAAVDQPEPQTDKPTVRKQPESRGRISLYVGLTAAGLVVCAGLCFAFRLSSKPDVRDHAVV